MFFRFSVVHSAVGMFINKNIKMLSVQICMKIVSVKGEHRRHHASGAHP